MEGGGRVRKVQKSVTSFLNGTLVLYDIANYCHDWSHSYKVNNVNIGEAPWSSGEHQGLTVWAKALRYKVFSDNH